MYASTTVEVELDARGRSVVTAMHCEVPLLVRVDGASEVLTLLLLGGAAGPLGGDDLALTLIVGPGADVVVRSVAAMLAQPGSCGAASSLRTVVRVGEGARLDWETQPMISVVGSNHRSTTLLEIAGGARVRWSEAVLLGRHEERSGLLALHQRVVLGGGVILDHELVLGEGAPSGAGAHGDVRWMRSEVLIGPQAATMPSAEVTRTRVAGVFPLAPGASLATSASSVAKDLVV